MAKRGISGVAKKASVEDKAFRGTIATDSFQNFAQKMGVGADNALSTASYGFNPVTRIRTLLEWVHRGSWIGGLAVDVVADDMTREGVEFEGELDPDDIQAIHEEAARIDIWGQLRDNVAWARLYGGSIACLLVEGQDASKPLRVETIDKGSFKGLLVLDRWMVEPSMSDLVTELGSSLGLPKFYDVTADAPALPRMRIHHSRCARMVGLKLPYWQRVQENLWGLSVLERVYDRMIAFDSATTGAAQLVYKTFIRTYKIDGLREIAAAGGPPLDALVKYTEIMRRFQNMEGMTLMDKNDEYEGHEHSAFGGLSDALVQFGQQVSGALQIPLVRLFGQSPAGFSTGDSDLRNYYDGIKQQQVREMSMSVDKIYRAIAASLGIQLPKGFKVVFKSLWQLNDEQKASISASNAQTILAAESQGVIDRATALRELKQASRTTGLFTNITEEMIGDAEGELPPSAGELSATEEVPVGDSSIRAAGVIFVSGGKILLVKRTNKGDHEGEWAIPGGKLEGDETAETAARRECKEEISVAPGKLTKLHQENFNGVDYTTFACAANEQFDCKLNDEHSAYAWFTIDEAQKRKLHTAVALLLQDCQIDGDKIKKIN